MTNQTQMSVNNRDIYFRTDGAINGDIVTVASLIVWADDKSPIDDIVISDQFASGNYLPVGQLKMTNQYYDKVTGLFWFDVKLKPITEPTNIVLQTSATIDGVQIPVRFDFSLAGPSPLVVSPVTFDGNKMEFDISASTGRLLRYPLAVLAVREIDGNAEAPPSKDKKIPYSFYVPISNNSQDTYAVMGQAEVDHVKHNFVVRTTISTNDGELSLSQTGENLISATIKLAKASAHIGINLPIKFQFENGTFGIINKVENFAVLGDTVTFDFLVSDIKRVEDLTVQFHLTEGDNGNAPIFFKGKTSVKRWSHGQSKIKLVVDSQTYKKNLHSLYMSAFWEDGTPVTWFSLDNLKPDAEWGVTRNNIVVCRSVTVDVFKKTTLTLSGEVDLSAYGIDERFPFSESIDVGSDIIPARMISGLGTVNQDEVWFNIAIRQNNGDIFKDVNLKMFNGTDVIKNQKYDATQGILGFSVSNTAVNVKKAKANIDLQLSLTSDSVYEYHYKGMININVPYQVTSGRPTHSYRKDIVNGGILVDVVWALKGNDGTFPASVNVTQVRKNGVLTDYKSSYNQGSGLLTITAPVNLPDKSVLYIEPTVSASGLGTFVTLPGLDVKYDVPGKVTYDGHEFRNGKVAVYFKVRGWLGYYPDLVQIDNRSWDKQLGVKLGKTYSEYDNTTGIMTVVFDIFDPDAPVFSAETEMKMDLGDSTVYPVSFSFTK